MQSYKVLSDSLHESPQESQNRMPLADPMLATTAIGDHRRRVDPKQVENRRLEIGGRDRFVDHLGRPSVGCSIHRAARYPSSGDQHRVSVGPSTESS